MVFDYKWLTNNKCNGMAKSAYTHTVTVTVKGPVGPARGKFEVNTNKNGETTFEPSVSFANHTAAVDVSTHFALEKKAFTSITSEAVFKYPENTFWGTKLTYDLDRKVLMGKTAVEVAKPFHKINFSLYTILTEALLNCLGRNREICSPPAIRGTRSFLVMSSSAPDCRSTPISLPTEGAPRLLLAVFGFSTMTLPSAVSGPSFSRSRTLRNLE